MQWSIRNCISPMQSWERKFWFLPHQDLGQCWELIRRGSIEVKWDSSAKKYLCLSNPPRTRGNIGVRLRYRHSRTVESLHEVANQAIQTIRCLLCWRQHNGQSAPWFMVPWRQRVHLRQYTGHDQFVFDRGRSPLVWGHKSGVVLLVWCAEVGR